MNCTGPVGNPDIAGIGVLVSLGIEGLLATVGSLCAIGLRMVYSWDSELPLLSDKYPTARKQYIAFKSFLLVFIDSAMYFSLSIQVAGLVYVLTQLKEYREAAMCLYAGLFSLFPIYLALFVVWTDLRRPVYRIGMLALVLLTCAALSIVVMYKFFNGDKALPMNECYREERKSKFLLVASCVIFWALSFSTYNLISLQFVPPMVFQWCRYLYNTFSIKRFIVRLFPRELSGAIHDMWPYYMFALKFSYNIYYWQYRLNKALLRFLINLGCSKHLHVTIRLSGILISFCGIWVEFILLVLSRQYQTAQKDGNQENIMGYGQILALLIWAPVAAEYFYVAFSDLGHGLTGRLPGPFVAQLKRDVGDTKSTGSPDSRGTSSPGSDAGMSLHQLPVACHLKQ